MGPGSIYVEVMCSTGQQYRRGDRYFHPYWEEHMVDAEMAALIESDPHLRVRKLTEEDTAEKRHSHAVHSHNEAVESERIAHAMWQTAKTRAEKLKAVVEELAPKPRKKAPEPTPVTDAFKVAVKK